MNERRNFGEVAESLTLISEIRQHFITESKNSNPNWDSLEKKLKSVEGNPKVKSEKNTRIKGLMETKKEEKTEDIDFENIIVNEHFFDCALNHWDEHLKIVGRTSQDLCRQITQEMIEISLVTLDDREELNEVTDLFKSMLDILETLDSILYHVTVNDHRERMARYGILLRRSISEYVLSYNSTHGYENLMTIQATPGDSEHSLDGYEYIVNRIARKGDSILDKTYSILRVISSAVEMNTIVTFLDIDYQQRENIISYDYSYYLGNGSLSLNSSLLLGSSPSLFRSTSQFTPYCETYQKDYSNDINEFRDGIEFGDLDFHSYYHHAEKYQNKRPVDRWDVSLSRGENPAGDVKKWTQSMIHQTTPTNMRNKSTGLVSQEVTNNPDDWQSPRDKHSIDEFDKRLSKTQQSFLRNLKELNKMYHSCST